MGKEINQTLVRHICKAVPITQIPQGKFEGVWVGYKVRFKAEGETYVGDTTTGIGRIAVPCVVTVSEAGTTVTTPQERAKGW